MHSNHNDFFKKISKCFWWLYLPEINELITMVPEMICGINVQIGKYGLKFKLKMQIKDGRHWLQSFIH